jgi:PST family polysaccharide transporter
MPSADDNSSRTDPAANGAPGSLTNTVVRGASIATAGYVVAQAISFASYLALARLLTPSQFGVFAAAVVVVGVGAIVGESGMLAALIQRRERVETALESAFVATLAAGVLLSALALAVSPLVGVFFHNSKAAVVTAAMSASMLFRLAVIVPNALLQRRFNFVRRVAIDPLGMLAFAAASVTSAALGLGVWSLVIGTYSQLAVDVVAAWLFAGWRPHPRRATMEVWRELARFGRPVVIAEVIRHAIAALPVMALGRFTTAGAIGQYNYAARVSNQPSDAILALGAYTLLPALARVSHDERRFRAALTRALRWMCGVSFPLGMLLVALGTPAIVVVFGARWHAAGEAVIPLGVCAGLLALDSIASEVWKSAGRTDMLPRMHGLSLFLTAALITAFGIPFGLIGVATGIAVASVGVGAYAVYGIHRVAGVPISRLLAEIWPALLAAALVGGGLFSLEHLVVHASSHGTIIGLALLAVETVLGGLAYLACLSLLAPRAKADLISALQTLKRRRRAQAGRSGAAAPRKGADAAPAPRAHHPEQPVGLTPRA